MITHQPTYASFKNYVFQPTYQQPLAELPGSSLVKPIQRFLNESPLIFELALASCGANLLTQFVTGRTFGNELVKKYCSSPGVLLAALLIAVVIEEAVFRAVLRPTPNRLRNIAAMLLLMTDQ